MELLWSPWRQFFRSFIISRLIVSENFEIFKKYAVPIFRASGAGAILIIQVSRTRCGRASPPESLPPAPFVPRVNLIDFPISPFLSPPFKIESPPMKIDFPREK